MNPASQLRTIAILGVSLATSAMVIGQDPVDIGLFQEGNALEVRIRPTQDFNGILSAIVFTVKWDKSTGASLGEMVQEGPSATYLPIAPSGALHEEGSGNYQVYAGFGFDALTTLGMTLEAGKEYTVARIPFVGNAEFELADDTWTGRAENNGDFYLSLNGRDMTGTIYKNLVNATGQGPVSIQPNPNQGEFTLVVPMDGRNDVRVELLNSLGQVVFSDVARHDRSELYRKDLDVRDLGTGTYHLRLTRNGAVESHKVVVQ